MKYWLLKTEPDKYSWDNMFEDRQIYWDGVRSYQAQNNMKEMKIGDLCFFYHSHDKEVVGVVSVCKEFYPDHTDENKKFGMVDVQVEYGLKKKVHLHDIKINKDLQSMILVKQARLSVSSVTKEEWDIINKMGI